MASTSSRSYSQGALGGLPNESSSFVNTCTEEFDTSTAEQSVVINQQRGKEGAWQPQSMPDRSSKEEGSARRRRTSTLEKVLMAVMFVFMVCNAVLVLYIVNTKDDKADEDSCKTMNCYQSASDILENLDLTADPCEDFYQFACGKWLENHPVTPHKKIRLHLKRLFDEVQEHLRDRLDVEDPDATEAYQKARQFYKSCEDTESIDSKGSVQFKSLIKTLEANLFPVLSRNWAEKNLTLSEILVKVEKMGGLRTNPLINTFVDVDLWRSTRRIIYFDQPTLSLPRDYYGNTANLQYLVQQFVMLFGSKGQGRSDAKDAITFEQRIAYITKSKDELPTSDKMYTRVTLRNLSQMYPQFNWLEYLQGRFEPEGIRITMDEEVALGSKWYFDNAFSVINATSQRTLLNYCLWRFVFPVYLSLDTDCKKAKKPRWEECVATTERYFYPVTGRMYVEKNFPSKTKRKLDEMVTNLKEAFKEMVQEADWMCEPTKKYALEKIDAMAEYIGYPRDDLDDTVLNSKFENLTIHEGEYFNNVMQIQKFNVRKNDRLLRSPVNKDVWIGSAATVNAYYRPSANSITFPAGIVHKPAFSDNYMDAMNYGRIGVVIGHEITHGFDNGGRAFNKDGSLKNWWQEDDLLRFEKRAQCLENQYDNYVVLPSLNMSIKGKFTLQENIADNGGWKEAFRAYQKLTEKRGRKEPKLPLLSYTPEQIFFLSGAQIWCSNMDQKSTKDQLNTDPHSPMRFRVIGSLQNNKDFSQAFNCPVGSYMNPAKKCRVW